MTSELSGPPAARGGRPAFPDGLPHLRPSIPDADLLAADVREIALGGILTNGSRVAELESRAAEYLQVEHCIAVSNCTAGLMLALRAAGLTGEVVVPSFTFAATAHAVSWNGLRPTFADAEPETLTLSVEDAERAIGSETSAIVATHVYGTPSDVEALEAVARQRGVRLIFDAAHAFGSRRRGTPIGRFGDAEVFSLSPTKVMVAAEGGIVATNDADIAETCRIGRDYGNPGDYDFRFVGLNARMSELHAAVALRSLEGLDERIDRRNELATLSRKALDDVGGISFPKVPDGDRTTYKDFTILVDEDAFGLDADGLATALKAEGIDTRRYYAPPVHRVKAYAGLTTRDLPVADRASRQAITLPMWTSMTDDQVERVAAAIRRIHVHVAAP